MGWRAYIAMCLKELLDEIESGVPTLTVAAHIEENFEDIYNDVRKNAEWKRG